MSGSRGNIIIVGGGIFGVTAALALRKRSWDVRLIEAGSLPRDEASSTDISKAIRMDYGGDDFYTSLMELAFAGWDRWNSQTRRRLYHEDGFLLLTRDLMQPGGFEYESLRLLRGRGHHVERIQFEQLRQRFPDWSTMRFIDGYLNPRGGWAESREVVSTVAACAQAKGVEISENKGFARLLERDSRIVGVETTDGEKLHADHVLVAAGPWTPILLPWLSDFLTPVGQPLFYFHTRDPARFRPPQFPGWAADIARTGWYGFPATDDGIIKIANHGPGRPLHPDAPRNVPSSELERCRTFLHHSLPILADAPLASSRLCLYCDSADGDFLIDHDPNRPGLIVAAGGSGHAFKFAPVIGDLIADVVERFPNRFAGRFRWRNGKGNRGREGARWTG